METGSARTRPGCNYGNGFKAAAVICLQQNLRDDACAALPNRAGGIRRQMLEIDVGYFDGPIGGVGRVSNLQHPIDNAQVDVAYRRTVDVLDAQTPHVDILAHQGIGSAFSVGSGMYASGSMRPVIAGRP